jgi:hypothetical protein
VKISLKGLSAADWDRRVPLPNKNGVPANQVYYTHWTRDEVRDILSESLGQVSFSYSVDVHRYWGDRYQI